MDFQELRFSAGFNSRQKVADYLQLNVSTVSRWESGNIEPPFSVIELMRMLAGKLPSVGRRQDWHNWTFQDEYLYTPNGDKFTQGDIMNIKTLYARLANSRAEIRQLNAKIEKLELSTIKPDNSNVIAFPKNKRI